MSDYQGNIVIRNPATPTGPSTFGRAPGIWKLNDVAYWIKQGVWPNPAIVPDTSFPNVSLLLSTTALGNANNNLFVDSSGAFNPLGRAGNTTQGSFTPYSTNWSNFFDGSGDYLTVSSNAAFGMGTGDFTIECWVNPTAFTGSGNVLVDMRSGTEPSVRPDLEYNSSGVLNYRVNGSTVISGGTLVIGTWSHVALARSGTTTKLFLNGVQVGSSYTDSNNYGSSAACRIGADDDGSPNAYVNGYMSNVRVVKGTAVYTSNFTVPTAQLTAISGTSLLTCQSNRFRDASTNNFTITPVGDTRVTDFSPFSPGSPGAVYNQSDITNWSGYFPGNGSNYLAGPNNAAFAMGTGDFTIEFWAYFTNSADDNGPIFDTRTSANNGVLIRQGNGAGGIANRVDCNCAGTTASSGTISFNTWTHVAVVRSSSSLRIYLDGVGGTAVTASGNASASNSYIGAFFDGLSVNFDGYLNNLRVVKGTAVYTGNFTPPTSNLTAISGTSLLTLQNAAFTDNSTNNFVITPFGNTTVTGNSPFNTVGYWSNYFDGSGDYFTVPYTAANFDWYTSGVDFTIEYWFFANSSTGISYSDAGFNHSTVIGNRSATSTTDYWSFGPTSAGTVTFYYFNGGANAVTSTATYSLNTWNHVAMTKTSSGITVFVNGVAGTTAAISGTPQSSTGVPLTIGQGNNSSFNGYISNLRIVRGTAIYSGNFTVPTTPLTAVTNTKLLTCQASRFVDNSTNALTLTLTGNTSVQSFDPFYTATVASNGGSMYFDGTGDYLTSPTSVAYDFGSNNFTIEGWFYFTNSTANALQTLYSNYTSFSSAGSIFFGKHTTYSGYMSVWFSNYTTGGALLVESTYPPNNAWTHYALVRNGNTFTLYRNGVSTASSTAFTGAATSGPCPAFIGAAGDVLGAYHFPGYMNGFRITKSAVYTSNFTPPTTPMTPSASTTLLLNGMNAGVFDATTINDMETVGNTQVRYPWPFAPANYWAGFFDGNGDYLLSPSNAAFALGTGDYTVECWIYATSNPSDAGIYEGRSGGAASDGFTLTAFSSSVIRIFSGGVLVASSGTSYVGQWTHVAVTRASGTTTLWINGVSQGTSSTSYNCTNADAVVGGGRYSGGSSVNTSFPGYISNFRIVKGTAVYTSTFTPSTTPLTAISNTSLLTCQNKTFIDNSSNAFTLTAFGNAAAGAIGPFINTGGTSTYFDGSGDNLFMPSSPSMNCGSGNWTVEGWVCTLTRTTNYPLIFGNNRGSFTTDALAITASNADSSPSYLDKFVFAWGSSGFSSPSAGNSFLLVSNVTNANGVWYHLAIVRNGTSIKMYRNGTEVASATVSAAATFNWGYNGSLAGGGNWDGAQGNWNGYLDDLRITNGVARYTSSFTPPTQPFPIY